MIGSTVLFFLLVINVEARDNRIQLYLLNILPFPDGRSDSGWDRALELIPAAQLAADHINNASHILPGYKLELISVDSEACGISTVVKGLVNTYVKVLDFRQSLNVVGLAGLFCSSVTNVIAPLFSYPNLTYIQMAGSTTPSHRDTARYPWLVHLISSSTVYNNALFALMETFNWRRISLIHDSLGIFFLSAAVQIKDRTRDSPDFDLVVAISVTGSSDITSTFQNLVSSRARIVFISGTVSEGVIFMCEAYRRSALYPGYVYIFHDRSSFDFTSNANITDCTPRELQTAINGSFFMRYELMASEGTTLISNLTYEEYYQEYIKRLVEIESSRGVTLDRLNVYANAMYDEVWSFALALNASLGDINDQNIDLENLSLDHSEALADIMRRHIPGVSFYGASGFVKFDANNEESSNVRIFQVNGNEEVLIGVYDSDVGVSLLNPVSPPIDTFDQRIHLLPLWLTILFTVITSLSIIFITVVLIFIILLRHRPEIKASSYTLNYIIFSGCYFLVIAAEMRTVSRGYPIVNDTVFTLICNIEVWLANLGINLIFSTLLMRLMRINRIFKAYGRVSKYWGDGYIVLWIFMICSGGIIIYIVWTGVDRIRRVTTKVYRSDTIPPFFESTSTCSCNYLSIWLIVAFCYSGAIIAVVMFLAIQTRKIKLSNYKDTKKISAYIFTIVITLATLMPLWFLTEVAINSEIAGHIFISSSFLSVGVLCQCFIFLPQICVTLLNIRTDKSAKKISLPMKRKKTQFSQL